MKRRGIILALLALPILTTFLILTLTRSHEPMYEGRSLSEWLAVCSAHARTQDSPEFAKACLAIRTIGTNALPYLLKKIRQEPLPWGRRAYEKLPPFLLAKTPGTAHFLFWGLGDQTAETATYAFYLLGTNAACAIPQLELLINDTNHPVTSQRAATALSWLGPAAFPHLVAALANTNRPDRSSIMFYFAEFMPSAVGTNACLPPLRAALNDPDGSVRSAAWRMLNVLAPEVATNTPPQ